MDLPDNYFRDKSPADIVAKVATITLANISLLGAEELRRIGWLDNPIVDKLYKLGSSGVWVAREQTADGQCPTEGLRNFHLAVLQKPASFTLFDQTTVTQLAAYYAQHVLGIVAITTDGAGAASNQVIATAVTGYKTCVKILGVLSSITEGTTNLVFQDEDDTALEGALAAFAMNFTASVKNTQLDGVIMRTTAISKAAEVDVNGHAAGGTILIYLEKWWEP